jgi:hypothetical protein
VDGISSLFSMRAIGSVWVAQCRAGIELFSTSFSSIVFSEVSSLLCLLSAESFRLRGLPELVMFRRFSSVDVRRGVRLAVRLWMVDKME